MAIPARTSRTTGGTNRPGMVLAASGAANAATAGWRLTPDEVAEVTKLAA